MQEILQDLYDRGEIYRAEYDGWYCVPCERFFTEKDLVDGKCPRAAAAPVERITESQLLLPHEQVPGLARSATSRSTRAFIQPDFRRNETLGLPAQAAAATSASRGPKSRLAWGIELPFDPDFVTYVWFDALVNYISAVGYRARRRDGSARWWPASCHLIGKDILTTHTVYWPTMLKAMGLPHAARRSSRTAGG